MRLFQFFLLVLILVSASFAVTAPKSSAAANKPQQVPAISISPEEMMIFMALLQSPAFKDNFVRSCSAQSEEWLGATQANKSCACAFNRLAGDQAALNKLVNAVALDGSGINFEKIGFSVVEPCIPNEYPSETDNAFVKECLKQKDLNKPTCECILKSVKRDYTVHSLIKLAFENQRQLETDLNLKTAQCLSK
ncbi:hypothetical protein [uncultured Fibrobacter sp.]|jgi:hypothetical protein|uniref:hypothetical protein n=1 Tax=uncultured Fibrobacter sp. TaxID=261512 RepID=UPI0025F35BFC|nr:hypothetical protein [uncultured Fibrobacter sp.]